MIYFVRHLLLQEIILTLFVIILSAAKIGYKSVPIYQTKYYGGSTVVKSVLCTKFGEARRHEGNQRDKQESTIQHGIVFQSEVRTGQRNSFNDMFPLIGVGGLHCRSKKSASAATMAGGPKHFQGTTELGDQEKGQIGPNLYDFGCFCFLR